MCLAVVLILSGLAQPVRAASAAPDLSPVNLLLSVDELAGISVNFHESSPQSSAAVELTVRGGRLVSSQKVILLSSAKPLLDSLHDLYPLPRFVTFGKGTEAYPEERLVLKLKDGRQVVAESTSQYPKGVPWNLRVWQGEPDQSDLLGSYVLLHDDFHAGLSAMWKALTGEAFPQKDVPNSFDGAPSAQTNPLEFYVPEPKNGFTPYADRAQVSGLPAAVLEPFVPVLKQNAELRALFEAGFTLFDAAFNLTVNVAERKPVGYAGVLALKAPASPDVVVTTVKIELSGPAAQVTTPLTAQAAQDALARRQGFASLANLTGFLPDLVFLNDLRSAEALPGLTCVRNPASGETDFAIEALVPGPNPGRISFYHLPRLKAWTLVAGFDRPGGWWDDGLVAQALAHWFPQNLRQLLPADLDSLSTTLGLKFRQKVTERKPQLIPVLFQSFPETATIHIANTQKEGDQSFASLEGKLILPENGGQPQMVTCGHLSRPSYDVAAVKTPDPAAPRDALEALTARPQDGWTPAFGLRSGVTAVQQITFTSSRPGDLQLLWTTSQAGRAGVYYSEGRADGAGWINPQRLGEAAWNLQAVSSPSGEVHLFWSAGSDPVGTVHVWRNAQGLWQKPEDWAGLGPVSAVLLDETGNLHLAWIQSDGQDEEFFYSDWNPQTGLSKPQNISRRLGNIGNYPLLLRADNAGRIHALWGHPLSGTQTVASLAGEAFDQAGVFYARQLRDGAWSIPEQIGVFAPFSTSLGLEFSATNEPVAVWQAPEGLRASLRQNGSWTRPALIQRLPSSAAAEIQVVRDSAGQVFTLWSNLEKGIFTSRFTGKFWQAPIQLVSAPGLHGLSARSGPAGSLHLLYSDENNSLIYTKVASQGKPVTTSLGLGYHSGSEPGQLAVDGAGFVYVLGPSDTRAWKAYLPAGGFQPAPAP